jgi:ankyrin repeat protein
LKFFEIIFLGETPLHIAIVYNDINSVKLLIKHGVDVNKRVVGDFNIPEQNQNKDETKKGKRIRPFFRRNVASQKQFNPQSGNPESK